METELFSRDSVQALTNGMKATTSNMKEAMTMDITGTHTVSTWWNQHEDSETMVGWLIPIDYNNAAKLRLLSCRLIRETRIDTERTVWDLLDEPCRHAVIVAERYANGQATKQELVDAFNTVWEAGKTEGTDSRAAVLFAARDVELDAWEPNPAASAALHAVKNSVNAVYTEVEGADYKAAITAARCQQADIVREIIPAEEIVPLFERHWISIQRNDHETLD